MPLSLSRVPDLIDKSIKRVNLKTSMAHKHEYAKPQVKALKKAGVKPGTKKAHKFVLSEGGFMKKK